MEENIIETRSGILRVSVPQILRNFSPHASLQSKKIKIYIRLFILDEKSIVIARSSSCSYSIGDSSANFVPKDGRFVLFQDLSDIRLTNELQLKTQLFSKGFGGRKSILSECSNNL